MKCRMIENFKKRVNIGHLLKDEKAILISKDLSDLRTYPEFLKYFRDLKKISRSNMIIGINFVYGWMPTIFDFRSNEFDLVVDILNKAKKGESIIESDLIVLRKCFNNSLVGTSKLLHFINPKKFAIWDSRVFHYLTGLKPYSYRLDKSEWYLEYLNFCKDITENPRYENIYRSIIKKVGYDMTKFRTIEMIMYLSDLQKSKK